MLVGVRADHRLQHRGAGLVSQGDDADLDETQCELTFQQRIDRDDERLHHVIEKMREADCSQNLEACLGNDRRGAVRRINGETLVHKCVPY